MSSNQYLEDMTTIPEKLGKVNGRKYKAQQKAKELKAKKEAKMLQEARRQKIIEAVNNIPTSSDDDDIVEVEDPQYDIHHCDSEDVRVFAKKAYQARCSNNVSQYQLTNISLLYFFAFGEVLSDIQPLDKIKKDQLYLYNNVTISYAISSIEKRIKDAIDEIKQKIVPDMTLKDVVKLIHNELQRYSLIVRLSILCGFQFNFIFRLDNEIDSSHQLLAQFNMPNTLQCVYYTNNHCLWSKVNSKGEDYKPINLYIGLKELVSRFGDMTRIFYANDIPIASRSDLQIAFIALMLKQQHFYEPHFNPA